MTGINDAAIPSTPPDLPGLNWRPLRRVDLAALVTLAGACHAHDGGLSFVFGEEFLTEDYFSAAPGTALGAFLPGDSLAACASVEVSGEANPPRARLTGMVRPDLRGQGLGSYLLGWSQAQANSLLAGAASGRRVLQVATEALTEPAHHLYRAYGFKPVSGALAMRCDLQTPLPTRALPDGISLASWQPELAGHFYQAYQAAFRERPGFPGWSAGEWIQKVTQNDLIADWTLLARAEGAPVGFVIGCIDLSTEPPGGYIWQIGVVPAWRRRGLGSALMLAALTRMRAGGAAACELEVHLNNPGAIEAYLRLGFETTGRRARYEQIFDS